MLLAPTKPIPPEKNCQGGGGSVVLGCRRNLLFFVWFFDPPASAWWKKIRVLTIGARVLPQELSFRCIFWGKNTVDPSE